MKYYKSKCFLDKRGSINIFDERFPFDIKRIFWLKSSSNRGNHGHYKNRQILFVLKGKVSILFRYDGFEKNVILDSENIDFDGVLVEPHMWHSIDFIEEESIVLSLCSHPYDANDYFY